ncbi:hypothetical protein F53441_14445 [Fusarium austroafricanum]|uniref:Uncharacterized protein n=1 Tax=Fusarium austroafricanum TaxID=2364996 RepID=A0A8H4JD66_9HYPO|nr:hypothetical protein F53441_14445 [Fusarium austroafricanum]
MGLFSQIDIERDFPDHKVKSMVKSSEWAARQHQGNYVPPGGFSHQNYDQYSTPESSSYSVNSNGFPTQTSYSTPSGLVDLQAGLSLESSGSEDDGRSGDEDGADARQVTCCGMLWRKGAHYTKHYNRKHNRRFRCVFYNDCEYAGADNRELHRHYWVEIVKAVGSGLVGRIVFLVIFHGRFHAVGSWG